MSYSLDLRTACTVQLTRDSADQLGNGEGLFRKRDDVAEINNDHG
jgi:hypothetical protein